MLNCAEGGEGRQRPSPERGRLLPGQGRCCRATRPAAARRARGGTAPRAEHSG